MTSETPGIKQKGIYIAIEGIDGTGKSSIMNIVAQFLTNSGFDVITVQEPTNEDIGKLIRSRKRLHQDHGRKDGRKDNTLDESVEACIDALLFAADRLQLLHQVIKPALEEGKIVLSDRSIYSSLAYQTCQGAKLEWVLKVNEHARKPDFVFLLDCPVEIALERLKNSSYRERFETFELLTCVREQYLTLSQNQDNWFLIDANTHQDAVIEEVISILKTTVLANSAKAFY